MTHCNYGYSRFSILILFSHGICSVYQWRRSHQYNESWRSLFLPAAANEHPSHLPVPAISERYTNASLIISEKLMLQFWNDRWSHTWCIYMVSNHIYITLFHFPVILCACFLIDMLRCRPSSPFILFYVLAYHVLVINCSRLASLILFHICMLTT